MHEHPRRLVHLGEVAAKQGRPHRSGGQLERPLRRNRHKRMLVDARQQQQGSQRPKQHRSNAHADFVLLLLITTDGRTL